MDFAPGQVVYLNCRFVKPTPKKKYMVVVCTQPKNLFFLINTEIHKFYRSRPELMNCQVSISSVNHSFLTHDSFIDYTNPCTVFDEDIESDCIVGVIDDATRGEVLKTLKANKLIPKNQKEWIIKAFA